MATKNNPKDTAQGAAVESETRQAPELLEIGELRKKNKVGKAIFAGVCAANEWSPGKQLSEDDFLRAVAAFAGAPASGQPRNKKKEAKR